MESEGIADSVRGKQRINYGSYHGVGPYVRKKGNAPWSCCVDGVCLWHHVKAVLFMVWDKRNGIVHYSTFSPFHMLLDGIWFNLPGSR